MIAPQDELYRPSSPDHTYGFRKCCEAIRGEVPIEEVARRYTDLEPLWGRAWFSGRSLEADTQARQLQQASGVSRI